MKAAVVLEKDSDSAAKLAGQLRGLGYLTAPVRTAEQALSAVNLIKFDVIVTCTAKRENDRRALTGELKRAAPDAAIVLITESDGALEGARRNCPGVSAVIKRPPSADALRRIVQFGIDGYGLQPSYVPPAHERRRARA